MGRPVKNPRELVDAMLWIFKTGAPWRDLPVEYGPWKTVYNNFLRWRDTGVWEKNLNELNESPISPIQIMLDSTTVRVHQHGTGAKKGAKPVIRILVD